jgi:hypothetical protein
MLCFAGERMTEWQGITIRDLLERVDLLNFVSPEESYQHKERTPHLAILSF